MKRLRCEFGSQAVSSNKQFRGARKVGWPEEGGEVDLSSLHIDSHPLVRTKRRSVDTFGGAASGQKRQTMSDGSMPSNTLIVRPRCSRERVFLASPFLRSSTPICLPDTGTVYPLVLYSENSGALPWVTQEYSEEEEEVVDIEDLQFRPMLDADNRTLHVSEGLTIELVED